MWLYSARPKGSLKLVLYLIEKNLVALKWCALTRENFRRGSFLPSIDEALTKHLLYTVACFVCNFVFYRRQG